MQHLFATSFSWWWRVIELFFLAGFSRLRGDLEKPAKSKVFEAIETTS